MKVTTQEEYGLRILLRIAEAKDGLNIAEISEKEGLTHHNTAKLCRVLRIKGYLISTKGHTGGYVLSKKPEDIHLGELLKALGGPLYQDGFCNKFAGDKTICTRSMDCSIRCLWAILQKGIDNALAGITLRDLIGKEKEVEALLCK